MPSRNRGEDTPRLSTHDRQADERLAKAKRIIALRYVFTHAHDRDDAIVISQALGLDDLLLPLLFREDHHAVS